ncbi:MAG: type II toxin-antitoxin system prevent-host-death family antitoxin [Deltaproteobacteria bacterium]|nr:type II toxin-antitoxin system prevent-host-death family antitoxin [Deltaproteobacteria bacterium]
MCYVAATTNRVGVRALRQNLSVHLRRVRAGATLEVTEHGRPVAVLAPLPRPTTALAHLIAAGRATPAKDDLLKLAPPRGRPSTRVGNALRALRRDER